MSEKTRNILALNYDSKTTEFIQNIFSGACAVTPVNNLAEVSEKAGGDFDVILTGYVVPAFSEEKATSHLSDIQKAFDDASSTLREIVNNDETLLEKREQEQANILAFLQEHVRQAEKEKVLLKQEMQAVTEKDEVYLKEKIEAEEKAKASLKAQEEAEAKAENALNEKNEAEAGIAKLREEDAGRITQLAGEANRLTEELENAMALAEQNRAEKASIEEKLTKLQENWEKYVAGA